MSKSEMLRIKEDYESANKYMIDYRMNLLSTFIERKLGLTKKNTKADNVINEYLHDISKLSAEKSNRKNNISILAFCILLKMALLLRQTKHAR